MLTLLPFGLDDDGAAHEAVARAAHARALEHVAARRRRSADVLEIVAFERGHFTSYSACGIPYWVGGDVEDRDQLIARSPEEHRARGIDLRPHADQGGMERHRDRSGTLPA